MMSVGVNYHSTRHTSTIRLVDYVFCYLFSDDLVKFLQRFYALQKEIKLPWKNERKFSNVVSIISGSSIVDRSTVRSDFDHFWPTFTWIQNWIICRCGRTHEEKKKKEEKEKRNQIFHFTTGTGGNPARPSGHWNIVTRAREPVGNGVTKSTYHYVLFNSSPRPQLLCARVPLENNNRLKCNVKMNRPYIIRREHKGTIYHFWVGTGRR